MATFKDFFFGANFALWEEAIADIFQTIEDQREAALNAIYLSTALIAELADRYGALVGSKPDPAWQLEVFREHLQEVIQAYLMMSSSRAGIQQVVAATTQVPPILRPINLLQRWLLGFEYLPNRFFIDLDGFVMAEVDGPYEITDENNLLVLKINGVEQSFTLPTGEAVSAQEVMDSINSTIIGALAFPFGKRFALETIETDVGGSIQVKVESTADTLFGLDNTERDNAPNPNGTGVLPFGWRLSGSYIPTTSEDPIPTGTDSAPISFDGAIFGIAQAKITGTMKSPFIGLMSPVFLTNGGFEDGFTEWDRTDGPDFFISTTKTRTGAKSLAVVTKVTGVTDEDGTKTFEPVVNVIKTFSKFVPEECTVLVKGFHQAKTLGAVYTSPATPGSVFEWTVSNTVFGYTDQQFSREPLVNDLNASTIMLTDPGVNFITKGVKVGMAVHVVNGSNAFDAVVRGVSTHQLLLDQWRNGPTGGPTQAHITSDAAAGSGVAYTSTTLQDPAKDFTTLGVQTGADYKSRDKVRVDETLSHFGQVTTERQVVRDIASITTTTNPNDTLVPDSGWGASPTPLSATGLKSGNPYSVYIRPLDSSQYTIFHTLNEIPDFADDFAKVSASILYEIRYLAFDGSLVHSEHHFFRPSPGDAYEEFTFESTTPRFGELVQLVITVGPDDQITETVTADLDEKVFLSQKGVLVDSEIAVVQANGTLLRRGSAPKNDYEIDYEEGSIIFHSDGPAATPHPPTGAQLASGSLVSVQYQFAPKAGARVTIDDITFRCEEDDLNTELHVAVDGKMQKIVFADPRERASGVITYSGIPNDGDQIIVGDETYEFDTGSHDTGEVNYTGLPNDGDTITIGGATYEFDDDCVVAPGNIVVLLDLSADQVFTNLTNAINSTSSQVTASIDTGTNTVTITATDIGQHDPAIAFTKSGSNYTLNPVSGGLAGGAYSDVVPPTIAVFVTTEDETWARLVEAININSTSVFAEYDSTAKTVTVKAIEPGLSGNDIVFDKTGAPPVVLNPATGFLAGGTATHAGGHIEYTGQPVDGDTFTVGTITYEFDDDGSTTTILVPQAGTVTTTGKNVAGVGTSFTSLFEGRDIDVSGQVRQIVTITDDTNLIVDTPFSPDLVASAYSLVVPTTTPIPIRATADETYGEVVTALTTDGIVTATQDTVNGRVDLVAVVAGTAGNSIVFSGTITNAALVPSGGFLSSGVDGDFVDPDAPTCDEVRDFINAHSTGFTASCETDGRITLTDDETGLKSCIVVGHGSANSILGFESDKGKTNSEDAVKPGWRLTVGTPGGQLVVVSRALQPANKFFGTDWHARFWLKSTSTTVKAHVVIFFEDEDGNMHASIENNPGTGTITTTGTAVVGFATQFTTELQVGDLILAADQVRRVVTITDDLNLTVDVAYSPDIAVEEFFFQHYTLLDPLVAANVFEDAIAVATVARDFGRFEAVDVKLLLNDVSNGGIIDIAFPYLTNEIGKSLHLGDNTIPRNKQREYKLYRMAVANPDVFSEVEAGLVGANSRIDQESISLSSTAFTTLQNRNLFPFSEIVERSGIKAKGIIQYAGQPADGDTITIGVNTFEFDNDSITTPGNNPVPIAGTANDTFQNLVDSINTLSPLANATHTPSKNTILVQALLAGAEGNGIVFAQDCLVVKLITPIGTLDGGVDGVQYSRGTDYIMRYEEGEIARLSHGAILDPSPSDLVITYSYFPGDVPLNTSYSQTIKPLGVKLEIDPTCLFFFRGRKHDFTDPNAINVNFEVVERAPDRFSHLKPVVRGHYQQVVHFSASLPHVATLDYAAMVGKEAVLIKTDANGNTSSIPFDVEGWVFNSDTEIELSTSTTYLAPGESALFDAEAEYEISYCVKFQFTTAAIGIADVSSAYALLPYAYKARQVEETKEDVLQVLILNTARQARLKLPAITDQGLAELERSLGGETEILSDDTWQFVDENTVEVFLDAFDVAAIYKLTYKSSKLVITTGPDCDDMELEVLDMTSGEIELEGALDVVVMPPTSGSMSMSGSLSAILTPPSAPAVFILIFSTTDDADFPFIGLDGSLPFTTNTAADVVVAFPVTTTIAELDVYAPTPPGLGNSITYKINVNGVDDPGITLVLSGTNNTATATGSVSVSAGDLVCLSVTVVGVPDVGSATFSLRYS